MLGRVQLPELRPQQGPGGEVEGPRRLLAELQWERFTGSARLQSTEVHGGQGHLHGRMDVLERLTFLVGEGGAQHLVTTYQFREAAVEHGHVQRPLQPHEGGHVVGGAVRLQLVDEP